MFLKILKYFSFCSIFFTVSLCFYFISINKNSCPTCKRCDNPVNNLSTVSVDIKGAIKNGGVYNLTGNSTINDVIYMAGGLSENAYTKNLNLSKKISDEMVIYIFTKDEIKQLKTNVRCNKDCNCLNNYTHSCNNKNNFANKEVIQNHENINFPSKDYSINNEISDNYNNTENIDIGDYTENSEQTEINEEKNQSIKISINSATKDDFMKLEGIGESKAQAIIEYRNINGHFNTIEELTNVKGIGPVLFEKIKNYITM